MTPDPLDDLGGLPPDVPASWAPGVRAEVDRASELTAESLWNRRWYVVPDDEVGGWAVATANKPTSQIDPTSTRDRVLLGFVTWDEHARWLVELHNRALEQLDD